MQCNLKIADERHKSEVGRNYELRNTIYDLENKDGTSDFRLIN